MELTELINHPERLDRDTLYELRSVLALNPYFQTARLLMLQNLYLLHDSAFDEELRRAAIYVTDRKTIFNMMEAAHYQLRMAANKRGADVVVSVPNASRTVTLIDTFLDSIPKEQEEDTEGTGKKRRPTPADAAVDYVAYLLESESFDEEETPQMKGQSLIDNFLQQEKGRILLSDAPSEDTDEPVDNSEDNSSSETESEGSEEEFFTETLARIYIKQGRYQKALDIITRLSIKFPQKNAYFADQIRFLEKLIINSNKNKK